MLIGYSKTQQCGHSVKAKKAKTITKQIDDKSKLYQWFKRKYGRELCEVCFTGQLKKVKGGGAIDPAHRHERDEYKLKPEMLWDPNQVIMCCRKHHEYMDRRKDERDVVFEILRGKDELYENS